GRGLFTICTAIEQFCQSKVEQLGSFPGRNQNIRRLQVAMDYQVAMCVSDCFADPQKEAASLLRIEALLLAVGVHRAAFDIFHDEERTPIGSSAAIVEAADIRMIEIRQDLALIAETGEHFRGVHAALHNFDRDALLKFVVVANGKIDSA